MKKYLFIDRDGTLVREPENKQIDTISQLLLLPNVIPVLTVLCQSGYSLVMVSNQDALGSESYPLSRFNEVQDFLLQLFRSQGIVFEAIHICPHEVADHCYCRKPLPKLLLDYLKREDWDRNNSFVIGDRESDSVLATNVGLKSFRVEQDDSESWNRIKNAILFGDRTGFVERRTLETKISCSVNVDQESTSFINTGNHFFDHMLQQLAKHAGIFLDLKVSGDWEIDDHHTIEDTAIVLGQVIKKSLANKWGIHRYGFLLPMDDALVQIALDLSGRGYLEFSGNFGRSTIGNFSTEMVPHFFKSLSQHLGASVHIKVTGENCHHMIEAIFKCFGQCLRMAIQRVSTSLPTTKGVL